MRGSEDAETNDQIQLTGEVKMKMKGKVTMVFDQEKRRTGGSKSGGAFGELWVAGTG